MTTNLSHKIIGILVLVLSTAIGLYLYYQSTIEDWSEWKSLLIIGGSAIWIGGIFLGLLIYPYKSQIGGYYSPEDGTY